MSNNVVDRNISILIANELPGTRRIVRNCLQRLGFGNMNEADDGQSALSQLAQGKYDLIISDETMPDMSSLELLKMLSDRQLPLPPCIVVSREEKQIEIQDNQEYKVTFISKPFTYDLLEQKLSSILDA